MNQLGGDFFYINDYNVSPFKNNKNNKHDNNEIINYIDKNTIKYDLYSLPQNFNLQYQTPLCNQTTSLNNDDYNEKDINFYYKPSERPKNVPREYLQSKRLLEEAKYKRRKPFKNLTGSTAYEDGYNAHDLLEIIKRKLNKDKYEITKKKPIQSNVSQVVIKPENDYYNMIEEKTDREREIIDKDENEYINVTTGNDFFAGKLNPIERRIITRSLIVDSMYRDNGFTNDFIYKLPSVMQNVVSISLVSMELPNCWYNISATKGNNYMNIHLYNMSMYDDCSYTITIPDGNYLASQFNTSINNYFQSIGGALNYIVFDINSYTAKTIIRAANEIKDTDTRFHYAFNDASDNIYYSPNFCFSIDFSLINSTKNITNSLGWYIGFRDTYYLITKEDTHTSYIDTTSLVSYYCYLSSESSYGSQTDNYVFFDVDDYHNNFTTNFMISQSETAYLGNNIMARIVLSSGSNVVIFENAQDNIYKTREYFGPVNLEKIRFRIIDRTGATLSMNENDYSFCLEIKQVY